jgi:hypothetical protein
VWLCNEMKALPQTSLHKGRNLKCISLGPPMDGNTTPLAWSEQAVEAVKSLLQAPLQALEVVMVRLVTFPFILGVQKHICVSLLGTWGQFASGMR